MPIGDQPDVQCENTCEFRSVGLAAVTGNGRNVVLPLRGILATLANHPEPMRTDRKPQPVWDSLMTR